MTKEQRKAIEILNGIKSERKLDGEQVISDDDYFFLLSFIIDNPQETIVAPYPVIQPFQPLTPYYGQRWEVTCKVDDSIDNVLPIQLEYFRREMNNLIKRGVYDTRR